MRRSPVRPVSDRRVKRDAGYQAARQAVWDRAGGRCEAIATVRCTGQCEQVHHRGGRGGEDPHRLTNLLGCCAPCHAYVHAHPEQAIKAGWSTPRHLGPATEPYREKW